MLSSRIVRLY